MMMRKLIRDSYILEGQGSSGKALKGLRALKGLMRRENKVLRAGTQLAILAWPAFSHRAVLPQLSLLE